MFLYNKLKEMNKEHSNNVFNIYVPLLVWLLGFYCIFITDHMVVQYFNIYILMALPTKIINTLFSLLRIISVNFDIINC